MRFVCSECGHAVETGERPGSCPACRASGASFWQLDGETEAVVVARPGGGRGWRYGRILLLAGVLCLIATPLVDEQVRSPVLQVAGDGPPVPQPVEPFEVRPPEEEPAVSEIDRYAPGTVAAWRRDPEAEERPIRASGSGQAAAGAGAGTPVPGQGAPPPVPGARSPRQRPAGQPGAAVAAGPAAAAPGGAGAAGRRGTGGGEASTGVARRCPPEPDPPRSLVFIVDASVSMGLPVDISVDLERRLDARIEAGDEEARAVYRQLMAGPTPKRLDFAKTIFAAAIDRIPTGFNAGLVSFRSCTRIEAMGPVKPDGFAGLREHVRSLAVQRGGDTAITDSLTEARRLLKGTGGRLVLVTDGQETCRKDPCAVHGDIAQDGIVVDVVDLTGTAALECLAAPSGGEVYAAKGSLNVAELTRFVIDAMDRACIR